MSDTSDPNCPPISTSPAKAMIVVRVDAITGAPMAPAARSAAISGGSPSLRAR